MGCHESRQREIQEKRIRVLGLQEEKQYKSYPNFSGISPNEKYLAYPFQNKINVINVQSSLKIKQFKIKGLYIPTVSHLDYFENSRMVCCAISSPRIQIYRADNYYKQINSIQGQNGFIRGLKIINQNQILICDEHSSIIVIDYTKKCQILKKTHYYDKFEQRYVEFDSQNQVIIFHQGSSINFYKMNGETAISYYDTIIYDRIELIKNTNHLISRHIYSLILWLMDYKQEKLIKLREFQNENQIYGTQFLIQQQLIILDCQFIIILDMNDLKITYRQRHYLDNDDGKYSNILISQQLYLTYNNLKSFIYTMFQYDIKLFQVPQKFQKQS